MASAQQLSEIGGGVVRRRFTMNGETLPVGTHLTAAQIASIANGRSLIRIGHIHTYPRIPGSAAEQSGNRFVVNLGFGKFDVIEGRKLNDEPMTKDDALVLAGGGAIEPAAN
jgi:hypothetical protein